MISDLSSKTALVTGGTRGIGRSIVMRLAEAGAKVAFTYRSSEGEAKAIVAELGDDQSLAVQADAADAKKAHEAVQTVIDAWDRIDILVVNAGITRDTLMIRMSEEDWDDVIATNLSGAFHVCRAAYRPMMKQRAGSIITMSSVVGIMGNAGQANYAASKSGLIGFTKSLARELGGRGIRVNAVAPGYIATDMTAELNAKQQEALQNQIPLGRLGEPEDVAAAVGFLASDASTYITGHVLHVDGGLAM